MDNLPGHFQVLPIQSARNQASHRDGRSSMCPHPADRQRLEGPVRVYLVVLAAGLVGLLGVARGLRPDPRGYGTHTQLGLGPCAFAVLTGRPCPSCGMTTSFAWFARGRVAQAWRASPPGCLIALLTLPVSCWLLLCAWYKQPVGFRSIDKPLMGLLLLLVAVSLAFWLIRICGASALLDLPGLSLWRFR